MSTANKLAYLGVTKSKIKDVINMTGVGITNDTFRSYAQTLYNGYINVLKDKDTLLDNMPKLTSTGSIIEGLGLPIYEDKMSKLSTQETTTGKNLANIHNIDDISTSSYKLNIVGDTIVLKDNANVIGFTQTNKTLAELCPSLQVGDSVTLSFKTTSSSGSKDRIYLYGVNSAWYLSSPTKTITQDMLNSYVVVYGGHDETAVISEFMISKTGGAYEPYTNGPAPNPSYPMEVNTVKGYRNLFDGILELGIINGASGADASNSNYIRAKDYIPVEELTNYKFSTNNSNITSIYVYEYKQDKSYNLSTNKVIQLTEYLTTNADTKYIRFRPNFETTDTTIKFQLTEGTTIKPYVPYGTNWIYTTISDGTNTKYVTIPLNNNEICGIGNYKDELIIDKNGHAKLNKKIGKVVLDGSETYSWTVYNDTLYNTSCLSSAGVLFNNRIIHGLCNRVSLDVGTNLRYADNNCLGLQFYNVSTYWGLSEVSSNAFKTWLSTHNIELYYPLATPQLIDLNYNVDLTMYEGTNNITNSEDMDMNITFIKDTFE